jgi:hypothetical protein
MEPGDIISYLDMCRAEGVSLQRGMNFRLRGGLSVILMSVAPSAPYTDRVQDDGRVLIYEGHDARRTDDAPDPKSVDQPMRTPSGGLTQNGLFYEAAERPKAGAGETELVRVYEKIRSGIWVYNGMFRLVDAWRESDGRRHVFRFKLELAEQADAQARAGEPDLAHTRLIPTSVKLEVWRRDRGRCVLCGSADNLHFDHIIPYSKGGSSLVAGNIQLLCARHNLEKRDSIV